MNIESIPPKAKQVIGQLAGGTVVLHKDYGICMVLPHQDRSLCYVKAINLADGREVQFDPHSNVVALTSAKLVYDLTDLYS